MTPSSQLPPRLRWHQFRLRTLLAAMALAAVLLAWWFQPFVVESKYDDGQPRTRFVLRRDWRGQRVAHGMQTWFLQDGTKFVRTNYGEPMIDADFTTLLSGGPDPDFDHLIWLITNTIVPESWNESWDAVDGANGFYTGSKSLILPDRGTTRGFNEKP